MTLYGGVGFPVENRYEKHSIATGRLVGAALKNRSSFAELAWNFEHEGEELSAVALNLAPAEIRGGYRTTRTDADIALDGKIRARFSRRYSSVDATLSSLGRGWAPVTDSLGFRRVFAAHFRRAVPILCAFAQRVSTGPVRAINPSLAITPVPTAMRIARYYFRDPSAL